MAVQGGQDIRITKTHKALADTLFALLQERPLAKITVNDICKEAMVSRSTFYLHFEDKYQLLQFCMQREQDRIAQELAQGDMVEMLHMLLLRIKRCEKLYQTMMATEVTGSVRQMFRNTFSRPFVTCLRRREEAGEVLPGPAELLAAFYASGIAGMLIHWIESGFALPVEELARCQYALLGEMMPEMAEATS